MSVIKIGAFLLIMMSFSCFSQENDKKDIFKGWEKMTIKKDTIYLKFNKNTGEYPAYRCKKFNSKKGIVFNLCKKGSLLFPTKFTSDTLSVNHLKNYKVSTMLDVNNKIKIFKHKTYQKLPMSKYDKLYQAYDHNDIFTTYIIETLNKKQFVMYPVIWRNQRVID